MDGGSAMPRDTATALIACMTWLFSPASAQVLHERTPPSIHTMAAIRQWEAQR